MGLNRQLNNETNTLEAAQRAVLSMHNLLSIELGNEPECTAVFSYNDEAPIDCLQSL